MNTLALLLAAAAVAHAVARALRMPPVPLLLVAGFALSFLGFDMGSFLQDALVLGVTALLFIAGLELDPKRPQGQLGAALRVGVGQFVTLAALGFGLALLLDWDPVSATYLGLALTASSTLVVVRLLQRRGEMFEPFGRLTVGVLLVQDLLLILLLPFLDRLTGPAAILPGIAATLGLVGAAAVVRRWVAPLLLRVERDSEVLLLAVLLVLSAFLAAAQLTGVPLVVGAFLAGVSLSRFPISAAVRPLLGSLGDFFAALFFTALGALVGLPTGSELLQALAFATLLLVATPLIVAALGERAGLPARPAVESGLLLAQASELSLVVGLLGVDQGAIGASAFTVLALVTGLTMLLTPLVATERVTRRLLRWHPATREARRAAPDADPLRDHVLLLGAGATGMPLLRALVAAGTVVVVVDDDPAVLGRAASAGAVVVRGDASDPRVMTRCGLDGAIAVVSTLRRAADNRRVLSAAGAAPVLVRVFEEDEARRIHEQGGIPVLTSDAAAESLVDWLAGL